MLCADSMGKEINSGVLIMQRSDTDLILCLSTCTDILMHSVPATLWHTGGYFFFTLFVQSLVEKKKKSARESERDTSCLAEMTLLPKIHLGLLMKILGLYAVYFFSPHPVGKTVEMHMVVSAKQWEC